MKPNDIANMADFIAQAIYAKASDDPAECWGDLAAEEQDEFRVIAHAAMAAHDAWLTVAGYEIKRLEKKAAIKRPALIGLNGQQLVKH